MPIMNWHGVVYADIDFHFARPFALFVRLYGKRRDYLIYWQGWRPRLYVSPAPRMLATLH